MRPDWLVIGLLATVFAVLGTAYLLVGTSADMSSCPAVANGPQPACDNP
jgi:hypothetical protein